MNVMIVTPKPIQGTRRFEIGEHDVWFRSALSGLVSLPVDILILAPGCTEEQRRLAMEKIRPTGGRCYELHEIKDWWASPDKSFLENYRNGLVANGLLIPNDKN